MKTSLTTWLAILLLVPFFHASGLAQTPAEGASTFAEATAGKEKKVVITKRSVDADGTETTETIIKKGKAAENFDPKAYLKANKNDQTDVDIRIENGPDEVSYFDAEPEDELATDDQDAPDQDRWNWNWGTGNGASCGSPDTRAFLGVEPDSEEDSDKPGIQVEIVRNSAAAKAGLRDHDVILKFDDTKTDDWDELTTAISRKKAGETAQIAFSRNGKKETVAATLTTHDEVTRANDEARTKRGYLGVTEADDEGPGAEINVNRNSAAAEAGLQTNDVILKMDDVEIRDFDALSEFMAGSTAGQKINIRYTRDGKEASAEATARGQNLPEKTTVQVWNKQKEACLGVFTGTKQEAGRTGQSISNFTQNSAAEQAGMRVGDVILTVATQPVKTYDELWNEISKHKPGEKVAVTYLRDGKESSVEATLNPCNDESSRINIAPNGGLGQNFQVWNWGGHADGERLREKKIITIRPGSGDAPVVNTAPPAAARQLNLTNFKAFPNPSNGPITVEFRGEAVPTVVNLLDISGRQLFHEELNGFGGEYNQQFDLTACPKGNVVVQVLQGEKAYLAQVVLN